MRGVAAAALLLGLAVAGCATVGPGPRLGWTYKPDSGTGAADGPLALFGEPETMAFNVLRCNAPERLLEFEDIEAEPFEGGRPIRFEAGGQVWSGEERMEPPDAVPVSVARLPLDHPLVSALERGAAPLRVTMQVGTMELPNHRAVRRMIRECRAATRIGLGRDFRAFFWRRRGRRSGHRSGSSAARTARGRRADHHLGAQRRADQRTLRQRPRRTVEPCPRPHHSGAERHSAARAVPASRSTPWSGSKSAKSSGALTQRR